MYPEYTSDEEIPRMEVWLRDFEKQMNKNGIDKYEEILKRKEIDFALRAIC